MTFYVTITDVQSEKTEERVFETGTVTVGRNSSNDLVLADPRVSGHHLELIFGVSPSDISVKDVGSSNGTFVEEERLQPERVYALTPGARVVIGSFLLEVKAKASAAVTSDVEDEIRFKRLIHEQLIERLDLRRADIASLSDEALRERAKKVVEQIILDIRWKIPSGLERDRLIADVLNEALALGPLEELLADDSCSEIMVNSFHQIYAEFDGKLQLTPLRFSSERAVLGAIERILAPIGRRVDESSPIVDARLKDGSRVNAVIRPLALQGPCITIRKFKRDGLTVDSLVQGKSLSAGMAKCLKIAVENRLNVVISGGTGSGKTTLLNILSSFVPEGQRIVTVEDAAELKLPQEHVVSFETRPPNLEGKGAITIRDLVRNALRMRPDRIIVGECRGPEALDMLQAMNTGHDGSMTTGHANSPEDMLRRLETMVLMAGLDLPVRAIREQISSAVHLIVQQTRFSDGSRKITAITEVCGMDYDEGRVVLEDIFSFRQKGYSSDGKLLGTHQATGYVPRFIRDLQERGEAVDASLFSPE